MSEFPQAIIDGDSYAVIGDPVAQSLSPTIHQLFAKQVEETITYHKWCLDTNSFFQAANDFFAQGGGGLNITAPHKQLAFKLSSVVSDRARLAGAVNTLYQREGKIIGDNTDGIGLLQDLARLTWRLTDKTVLLLGAGGAVRGVLHPLILAKPRKIIIANRTLKNAALLQSTFLDLAVANQVELTSSSLEELSSPADIVINGTSTGLSNQCLPLATAVVRNAKCYDMVYGAEATAFMTWSLQNGAREVADGLGMLIGQAAEAFFLWRGVRPETQPVIEKLRQQFALNR